MSNPAVSLRTWLSKKDTVTLKELDHRLTCDRKQLAFLVSSILGKTSIRDDERISADLLRKNYDKLKPYIPETIDGHAIIVEKAKAAKAPKRTVAKRAVSNKAGEVLPEQDKKGFIAADTFQ